MLMEIADVVVNIGYSSYLAYENRFYLKSES